MKNKMISTKFVVCYKIIELSDASYLIIVT